MAPCRGAAGLPRRLRLVRPPRRPRVAPGAAPGERRPLEFGTRRHGRRGAAASRPPACRPGGPPLGVPGGAPRHRQGGRGDGSRRGCSTRPTTPTSWPPRSRSSGTSGRSGTGSGRVRRVAHARRAARRRSPGDPRDDRGRAAPRRPPRGSPGRLRRLDPAARTVVPLRPRRPGGRALRAAITALYWWAMRDEVRDHVRRLRTGPRGWRDRFADIRSGYTGDPRVG